MPAALGGGPPLYSDPPYPDPDYVPRYFLRIVARDEDGAASASSEASGSAVQVTGPNIAAETIEGGNIKGRTISANKLAATLVLASTLTTAEAGQRVTIDPNGVRLYSPTGDVLVDIPTDPDKDAIFSGDIVARTLTVIEGATLRGESYLDKGASMTLLERLAAPGTAPTVAIAHDYRDFPDTVWPVYPGTFAGLHYDAAGDAGGATPTFWVGCHSYPTGHSSLREYRASDGALLRTIDLGEPDAVQGVTRVGSHIYVLASYAGSGTMLAKYVQATLALVTSVAVTTSHVPEALGTDGTDLLIVLNRGATLQQPQVQKRSAATLALSSTVTCSGVPNLDQQSYFGITAQGGLWWIAGGNATLGFGGVIALSTAGAYQANREFVGGTIGVAHDGAAFWTLVGLTVYDGVTPTGPRLIRHTAWDWTTESAVYWVGYIWRNAAGPYETTIGPRASINLGKYRRTRVSVSLPTFPAGVDAFRVYVERAASAPATTALKRQAATTYLTSEAASPSYLLAFDTGGAAPPTTNSFPGGISEVKPATTGLGWLLRGDGAVAVRPGFDVQELVNASSVQNIGATAVLADVNIAMPSGWNSYDVLLIGKVTLRNSVASDHRATAQLESPASTVLNQPSSVSLYSSAAFAEEPCSIPLEAYVTGLTGARQVRIVATVTGGTTTSGDTQSTNRYLLALLIRRT